MDRGDGGFIMHESFKDLRQRRAEQEAYRKALEEQIMQRKKMQEDEMCGRNGRLGKKGTTLPQQQGQVAEQQNTQTPIGSVLPPTPTSFRRPKSSQNNVTTQVIPMQTFTDNGSHPPLHIPDDHLPAYPQPPRCVGTGDDRSGRMLYNLNQPENFNEPHPAKFTGNDEQRNYNDVTGPTNDAVVSQPGSGRSLPPNIPPECIKYIQEVYPGFTMPVQSTQSPQNYQQEGQGHPSHSSDVTSKSQKRYNQQHAFSSGSTSESSSFEDVSMNVTQASTKPHVSLTSEQLEGVKVSRNQYRAELQQQIEARKRREEEQLRKEQEAEERIQEKIRIEQEKMQREYEEELRRQQQKELEDEKKRLAALGKHSEIIKAEEKMKTLQKRASHRPPSQMEAWNVKTVSGNEPSVAVSDSKESIDSIGEFFDTTMAPRESGDGRSEKYINPDDRIVPAVAKRLREEALRKARESMNASEAESSPKTVKNESWSIPVELSNYDNNNNDPGRDNVGVNKQTFEGRSLTSRLSPSSEDSFECDTDEPPAPGMDREISIRSAPCRSSSMSTSGRPPKGQDFLASLKSYLKDEKAKLMERIQAKGSKSNEEF